MAPKSKKPPPTPAAKADPKASRAGWKTGEQLEWMLTHWSKYLNHQNEKSLERFWPHIYHGWHTKWPITPSSEAVALYGSREEAILVLRMEINTKIRTWYHNHGRPSSKAGKSDLRLDQGEKRKLAPVQFYCTYAWNKGLGDIVIKRWNVQKSSYMSTDDDDPAADAIQSPASGSHIPINFKIKIAKEQYDSLTPAQKKHIDDLREAELKKQYRPIPDISDETERVEKLLIHQRNQPSVAGSMLRILKNLEDQAGGIAVVMVGHINPADGVTTFQGYCQGKTSEDLDFLDFCGDEWDITLKRFREWGMTVFGELDTKRRAMFLLPPDNQGSTSSASRPEGSDTIVTNQLPETLLGFGGSGDGPVGEPSTAPHLHVSETMQAVQPQTSVLSFASDQPPVMMFQTPGNSLGFPAPAQDFDFPQSFTSWEVLPPSQFAGRVDGFPMDFPPTAVESLFVNPSSSQPVTLNDQFAIPPVAWEPSSPSVVIPLVLESTSNQSMTSPIGREPVSLVTSPVLGPTPSAPNPAPLVTPLVLGPTPSAPHREPAPLVTPLVLGSATATANQSASFPLVHESTSLITPVLDSSQMNLTVVPPVVPQHPRTLNVPQSVVPSQVVAAQRPTSHPSATGPLPTELQHPPDLVGGVTGAATTKTSYRTRGNARKTTTTRRDSIDGAPDIILSLGSSGYEVVHPPSQEFPGTHAESDADSSTQPSTTPPSTPASSSSLDDLVIPSSQQSLEELVIPPEALAVVKTTSSTTPTTYSAPREIPTYSIDKSDVPSWLNDRAGRLDYVLSVEGGEVWKRLIATWIRQERRVGFGLNEVVGASLSHKKKPRILGDYFKWHHTPSKGDSVVLPAFGGDVATWWTSLQPEWRHENSPDDPKDYSYILAGGKKGVYLLILCLAWWDKAYGRDLEIEKGRRRDVAKTGKTTLILDDLQDHDTKWLEIVNDLLFVMELAQAWPVPGEGSSHALGVTSNPARSKRAAERSDGTSARKRAKKS